MPDVPDLEPLLDPRAVGRILGVHPATVVRLAKAGTLPGLCYARRWRFRRSDIQQWLDRRLAPALAHLATTGPDGR